MASISEDGGSGPGAGREHLVDPGGGDAGPCRVVDRNHVDVVSQFLEPVADGVGPLGSPFHERDSHEGQVGTELVDEHLSVVGRDDDHDLLDIVAVDELLGRVEPHRPSGEWRKRLFVVGVLEPAALAGSRQDYSEAGHGICASAIACGCGSAT